MPGTRPAGRLGPGGWPAGLDAPSTRPYRPRRPSAKDLNSRPGDALTLVKPLKSIGDEAPAALLLSYPMARAMAPYEPMLAMIVLIGALGIALLVIGSWMLARSVTRPISALAEAVHRLERGENVTVELTAGDELGRLAESFNSMAAEIRERERRITHLALHDAETNLPNRLALEQRGGRPGWPRPRRWGLVAVLALGIDRFARVRGAIGYALAGTMISEIGQARLQRAAPGRSDRPAGPTTPWAWPSPFARRTRPVASPPICSRRWRLVRVGDHAVDVTLTLGLALWPDHGGARRPPDQPRQRGRGPGPRKHARSWPCSTPSAYGDPARPSSA